MRTASTWLLLGAGNALVWLLWPTLLPAPAWWIAAIVTSAVLVALAAYVLARRDLPAICLATAAGVAVGWSSVVIPSGDDLGLLWSLAAVGVFTAGAVLAAVLAGLVVRMNERRSAPPGP